MRTPPVAEALQLIRLRQFAPLVGDLEPLPDSQVVDWQHVRPAKVEDEEHFDRPAANSLYGGELLDPPDGGEPPARIQGRDPSVQGPLRPFLYFGPPLPPKAPRPQADAC